METAEVSKAADETPKFPGLSMKDRCDATRSGVEQAWVRFQNGTGGIIDLCKHHADKLEANLIGSGFIAVEDKRTKINTAPSPSATVLAEADLTPEEDE